MKGHTVYFVLLSLIGILIGIALMNHGINGRGLGSGLTLIVGIFIIIKEILDVFN